MDGLDDQASQSVRTCVGESASRDYRGCDRVAMTLAEMDADEGRRVECWDAATRTAMVLREPSVQHDACASRLVQLVRLIAHGRGAAITSAGSADLVATNAAGARELILQAAFVSRGVPVSNALRRWLAEFDDAPDPAGVIRLAFTCRDADEFLRRVEDGGEADA